MIDEYVIDVFFFFVEEVNRFIECFDVYGGVLCVFVLIVTW